MSGCRKMAFQSRGDAKAMARDMQRRGRGAAKSRPYECGFCGLWHLTSMSKVEQRSRYGGGRVSLTYEQIIGRLESIEADVETRQSKGEKAAEDFFRAKRDFELEFAKKFMDATGTVTERKLKATQALDRDPAYLALLEAEGAYEGWKAVMRALEQRASIGQSLLKAQRETGG